MVKKLIWVLTTLLVILAMVLSACSSKQETTTGTTVIGSTTPGTTATTTATTTQATTTTATTSAGTTLVKNIWGKMVEKPQYGGTLSFIFAHYKATDYFDPIISAIGGHTASVTYDRLVAADWSKGPEGSGENPFLASWIPVEWRSGVLAESWEIISPTEMIYHIRHGVFFQNKLPANGREMNAKDVIYTVQRGQQDTRYTAFGYKAWTDTAGIQSYVDDWKRQGKTQAQIDAWLAELKSVNYPIVVGSYMIATDQWTIKYRSFFPDTDQTGWGAWIHVLPIESAKFDMQDPANACGTGAWTVKDAVAGSSVLWQRNPNYWMSDPNLPGNKLPYADYLRGLIIIDLSTQIASIRTHKIDISGVDWDQVDPLKKSNPELLFRTGAPSGSIVIFMRTDIAPFNNVKVRQALAMGIDRQTIIKDFFKGNAILDAWPCLPSNPSGYTPYDQMPPELKKLFEYHPTEAKQLLADAGYPNGLNVEVDIYQSQIDQDQLQIVKEQWATIGVTADIKVVEGATHSQLIYSETYPSMIYSYWGNASPEAVWGWAHGGIGQNPPSIYAFSKVIDPIAQDNFTKWGQLTDSAAQSALMKAEYLRQIGLVWEIPLCTATGSAVWQPYIKGYSGEANMGLTAEMGANEMFKFVWVDSKIKSKYVK